jgi:hypothetical protein
MIRIFPQHLRRLETRVTRQRFTRHLDIHAVASLGVSNDKNSHQSDCKA